MNEAVNEVTDTKKEKEEDLAKTRDIIMNEEQQDITRQRLSLGTLTYDFLKRMFDIICGLIGIIFLIPLIIIIKI